MIVITNEDNMQLMSRYPDGHFDLAIVDPPYGVLNKTSRGGDRILDTHLGSGTIAIACYNAGISLTACEISRTYYENAIAKISEYIPADLIDLRENECNIIQTPE